MWYRDQSWTILASRYYGQNLALIYF
jgi:hypothetical protein